MIELAADGGWPRPNLPMGRYVAGKNMTGWAALEVSPEPPREWTVVVRDLWKDCGDITLTGIAPTVCGGPALFDSFELFRELPK